MGPVVPALAIRSAIRSSNYCAAETQLATLKQSSNGTSLRLPLHAYIHGILRQRQPLDCALREVGWMFARGFKVRAKTLRAVLSFSKLVVKGEPENEERKDRLEVLGKQGGAGAYDLLEAQHLGVAVEVLKLIRTNERTAPTMVTLEMYENLVRSYLVNDEFVAAALVFERMIEDWAGWLSTPATPTITSSASDMSPKKQSLHLPNSAVLTPMQFADRSHHLFHSFCVKLKSMLWKSRSLPFGHPPESEATVERLQYKLIQATCTIVSLLDRRILPYFNIYKLLSTIALCNRVPSYDVRVKTGNTTADRVATDSHLYLRGVASSFINDVASPNFSPIPEISELLRSRKVMPVPNFNLVSYRVLLLLAFRTYRDSDLARKVILHMLGDDELRRKCLDRETCRGLTRSPVRLSRMGLDRVVENYVWNMAGVELTRPVTFQSSPERSPGLPHHNGKETQVATAVGSN